MKLLALYLIACACAFAQWSNVTALTAGRPVIIEKKGGASIRGEFVSATAEALTVHTKQQEVSVQRADVARVEVKRNGHAKWWGLAIGAGGGAAIGGGVGQRAAGNFGDVNVPGVAAAILAAAGGLIGLAIGAGLDTRHSTIYHG